MSNLDTKTIASFGDEWSRFDQAAMSHEEAEAVFRDYFAVFPWEQLPPEAEGFDMGCGSGRWSRFVALNALDTNSRLVPGQKVKLVVY